MIVNGLTKEEEEERIESLPYTLNHNIVELLDFFKYAVWSKNTSAVIIVDGRSGQGKTTLSNQLALYCDRNYGLNKLHYNPDTFLEGTEEKIGLANCKPGDVIVFDEAMLISSRSALSHINRMIVQAMSMIRSKRVIIIFNVNSIFDLDRNLALSRADVLFHVYGQNLIDRGNVMAFFKALDGKDRLKQLYLLGKKYYDYGHPKSNFNCTFPMNFVLDEEQYEIQKQKGVNDFLRGTKKEKYPKAILSRDKYVIYLKENSDLTTEEIADIGGISRSSAFDILFKHKKLVAESTFPIAQN